MKIKLIWLKNNKKISFSFLFGLVLASLGLGILAYSLFDFMTNELVLLKYSSSLEQWRYDVQMWNNIYSTIIIPTSIILFLSGIATILILNIKISNLNIYLKTKDARWYWIIMILAITAIVALFVIPENFYPLAFLRYVLGVIFILYLPGYTLIKTLFPTKMPIKASGENLDKIERIALSFALSLVIVPIVGLFLNYTPWGIRLSPIVLCLFAFSVIFASIALIREYQVELKGDSVEPNASRKMT